MKDRGHLVWSRSISGIFPIAIAHATYVSVSYFASSSDILNFLIVIISVLNDLWCYYSYYFGGKEPFS